MKPIKSILACLALAGAALAGTAQAQAQSPAQSQQQRGPDKVVYHIDNTEGQATKGLRNIRNHLDTAPDTRVIVVAHADGVDFLMDGAKDKKNANIDYGALVAALKSRGVRFEVCEITLKNRNLKKEQFSMDAEFTPSGVVRVAQLQTREGYAYIKP
ncbi:MAG: hypothetical protein JWP36_1615 [Paucimonas sp.]|nr:hypothetical protein [Paucimonas sp.]